MNNSLSYINTLQSDLVDTINNLNDERFTLKDSATGEEFYYEFDMENITTDKLIWFKQVVVQIAGGYVDEKQNLHVRKSTFTGRVIAARRVIEFAQKYKADMRFTSWTLADCRKLLIETLKNKLLENELNEDQELMGRGPVENVYSILSDLCLWFTQGKINDGIRVTFPKQFLEFSISVELENHNMTFALWSKGGSWGTVPIPIAMLMLSESIDVLRDDMTTALFKYFELQRSDKAVPVKSLFSDYTFNKFLSKGSCRFKKTETLYKNFRDEMEEVLGKKMDAFPWSADDISRHCKKVYDAAAITFFVLTGVRISEISSIRSDDYYQEGDGTWVFKSDIDKTNFGLSEVRTMYGLVAEAANALVKLSYLDKDETSSPLFARCFYGSDFKAKKYVDNNNKATTDSAIRRQLKNNYKNLTDKYGVELLNIHPTISPHQFRHTFVEFSLRRFDGDVLEAIRAHFRHAANSTMALSYAEGKLNEQIKEELESEYIKELIKRIAMEDDSDQDFYGAVALYIKRKVKDKHEFVTTDEVDEFVNKLAEEFEIVAPHEYGYCLVRKATRHLAKCLNKKTGLPEIESGCFEYCSGCVNSFHSKKGNGESIIRTVLSHEDFIERYPLKNTSAHKISEKSISQGRAILKQMGI